MIYIPYARVNCLKTVPFTAVHTYIAHIWQYPPGEELPSVERRFVIIFTFPFSSSVLVRLLSFGRWRHVIIFISHLRKGGLQNSFKMPSHCHKFENQCSFSPIVCRCLSYFRSCAYLLLRDCKAMALCCNCNQSPAKRRSVLFVQNIFTHKFENQLFVYRTALLVSSCIKLVKLERYFSRFHCP